jgi:hypothetical protein
MLAMFRSELSGYTQAVPKKTLHVWDILMRQIIFRSVYFKSTCHFKGIVYMNHYFADCMKMSDMMKLGRKIVGVDLFNRTMPETDSNFRKSLFKLYINYGEKCLRINQRGNKEFVRAWANKPFLFCKKNSQGCLK